MTRRRRLLALGLLLVLTATACNPFASDDEEPPPPPPTPPPTEPQSPVGESVDGTLRIGAVLPLTGSADDLAPGLRAAVEMAIDDINDAGGVDGDVELVIEDSQSTAEGALAATNTLIDEHQVDAIVGPVTSPELTGGMLERALAAGRLVCTPTASAPSLTDADTDNLVFSATGNRDGQVELMAAEIADLPDDADERVAIVRRAEDPDMLDLSQDLRTELEDALGGADAVEIVADVEIPAVVFADEAEADAGTEGSTDADAAPETQPVGEGEGEGSAEPVDGGGDNTDPVDAAIAEIGAARPDAIVVLAHPGEAALLFRAMFEADLLPLTADGIDTPIYVGDALASDLLAEGVDPRRPGILEDVIGVRPEVDPDGPDAFVERLKAEQAVVDVDFAARAFECTTLIGLSALAAGVDDPNQMKTQMIGLTRDGEVCGTFEDCVAPALDGDDVHYRGVLDLEFNDDGEVRESRFEVFRFTEAGDIEVLRTNTVINPQRGSEGGSDATEPTKADP